MMTFSASLLKKQEYMRANSLSYKKLQNKKNAKAGENSLVSNESNDAVLEKAWAASLDLYELEQQRNVVR